MKLIKNTVQKLSLALFSVFLYQAYFAVSVFAQESSRCDVEGGPSAGLECAAGDSTIGGTTLFEEGGVFTTVVNVLLFIVGAISVIMLIVGGIRYVVSSGDQNAVTNAKNTILYAIIGLVVAFLAYAGVRFIIDALDPSA